MPYYRKITLWAKLLLLITILGYGFPSYSNSEPNNEVIVGIAAGTQTTIWETVQKVALEKYGLKVVLVPLSEYDNLNKALDNGDLDANAFQHRLYLKEEVKLNHYHIQPVAKTFVHPVGLYSIWVRNIKDFKEGNSIGIAQNPIETARALRLLQQAGLITLKSSNISDGMTLIDVKSNSKKLKIVMMDPALLANELREGQLTAAVLNNNYANGAGFKLKDALVIENKGNAMPYTDLIVARVNNANTKKIQELVAAYQSPEVKAEAQKIYGKGTFIGW